METGVLGRTKAASALEAPTPRNRSAVQTVPPKKRPRSRESRYFLRQRGTEGISVTAGLHRQHRTQCFVDRRQLLLWRSPIRGCLGYVGLYLLFEAPDAFHRKLVEIAGDDSEEPDPLQQRIPFVQCLMEHAPLESERTQFTIEIQRRVGQVDICRLVRGDGGSASQPSTASLVCSASSPNSSPARNSSLLP